ncbi:MAG: NAD-dependent epimerase/dehydratase family protein [Gemmatimonadetes bacterium]|nr:NAD-dependent epimerase/dehydratase family protein [Gemmatimonadota bacterium]
MHRALVTGGAGFIGSHVADALIAAGFAVDVVDDLSRGRRDQVPAGAAFHQLDIRSPEAAALVRDGGYDVVCHLAAQIDVRVSVADPVADASRNILGTLNLLEGARAAARPPRVVFSSTGGAIYGDLAVPPSREEEAKDPESPYGIAKLSVEYYLAYYARQHGLETVALRYSNVYGPRQDPHGEAGVVAIFCGRLLDARALTVFGDGTQTRDYVYVGDVAAANVCAARAALPAAGRVDARAFNVGTGVGTSVLALAATLQQVAGTALPVEHLPPRTGEQARSFIANDKGARVLGWRPAYSLADGLATTYAWFRSQHRG